MGAFEHSERMVPQIRGGGSVMSQVKIFVTYNGNINPFLRAPIFETLEEANAWIAERANKGIFRTMKPFAKEVN